VPFIETCSPYMRRERLASDGGALLPPSQNNRAFVSFAVADKILRGVVGRRRCGAFPVICDERRFRYASAIGCGANDETGFVKVFPTDVPFRLAK